MWTVLRWFATPSWFLCSSVEWISNWGFIITSVRVITHLLHASQDIELSKCRCRAINCTIVNPLRRISCFCPASATSWWGKETMSLLLDLGVGYMDTFKVENVLGAGVNNTNKCLRWRANREKLCGQMEASLMIRFIFGIVLIDPVYWLYSILCQVNHFFEVPTLPLNLICRSVFLTWDNVSL